MGKSESPLISMQYELLPIVVFFFNIAILILFIFTLCIDREIYKIKMRLDILESVESAEEKKRWWRDYDKKLLYGCGGYQPIGKPLKKGELPPLPRGGTAESGRHEAAMHRTEATDEVS
jgi:hypothetical protein